MHGELVGEGAAPVLEVLRVRGRFLAAFKKRLTWRVSSPDDVSSSDAVIAACGITALAVWLAYDRYAAGASARFYPTGLTALTWYGAGLLALAWVLHRVSGTFAALPQCPGSDRRLGPARVGGWRRAPVGTRAGAAPLRPPTGPRRARPRKSRHDERRGEPATRGAPRRHCLRRDLRLGDGEGMGPSPTLVSGHRRQDQRLEGLGAPAFRPARSCRRGRGALAPRRPRPAERVLRRLRGHGRAEGVRRRGEARRARDLGTLRSGRSHVSCSSTTGGISRPGPSRPSMGSGALSAASPSAWTDRRTFSSSSSRRTARQSTSPCPTRSGHSSNSTPPRFARRSTHRESDGG